jgi:hypothetical protein
MSIVRIKGFQIFKDRHGRPRCYHRKTRTAVDLEKAQSVRLNSLQRAQELPRSRMQGARRKSRERLAY